MNKVNDEMMPPETLNNDERRVTLLIKEISSDLLNTPINVIKQTIDRTLSKVGEYIGSNSSFIILYNMPAHKEMTCYEWSRDCDLSIKNIVQDISLDYFQTLLKQSQYEHVVIIRDTCDDSDNRFEPLVKVLKTKSIVLIPLSSAECDIFGFLGFDVMSDDYCFDSLEYCLVEIYTQMLTHAILRFRLETELIDMKENHESSYRVRFSYLANLSHEIRTPLNGILGYISLLAKDDLSSEERKNIIDPLVRSGERLRASLNAMIETFSQRLGS